MCVCVCVCQISSQSLNPTELMLSKGLTTQTLLNPAPPRQSSGSFQTAMLFFHRRVLLTPQIEQQSGRERQGQSGSMAGQQCVSSHNAGSNKASSSNANLQALMRQPHRLQTQGSASTRPLVTPASDERLFPSLPRAGVQIVVSARTRLIYLAVP